MVEQEELNYGTDIQKIVDNLSLMDDDLMGKVFDGNIPATRLVLRTILGRDDIEIVSVAGQKELRSPDTDGRTIRLDIVATDSQGATSDIEVQREKSGAHPKRARFHSSMLDSRMLKAGQKFHDLKDSHTIFITEHDYFGDGLPVYSIDRRINENGKDFADGSHILYVNGDYDGDDALGRLMKDFKCKNANDMHYPELAEGVRHFKEEGGRNEMCELVENFAKKYAKDYARIYAADLMEKNDILEAENGKLEAEISRLREELSRLNK